MRAPFWDFKLLIPDGFGGPGEVRTLDLMTASHARSQLRHRPTSCVTTLPTTIPYCTFQVKRVFDSQNCLCKGIVARQTWPAPVVLFLVWVYLAYAYDSSRVSTLL